MDSTCPGVKRILIVEDEHIVALDIKLRLENLNYVVVGFVASGEEALSIAEAENPDLVLMDIHLKGRLDGIESANLIREKLGIPVIFITAYVDEMSLERARITDAFGYIIKPFHDRELQINIDLALYKHHVENRLASDRYKFEAILKSIVDGVIAVNNDDRIDYINPSAIGILGLDDREFKNEPVGRYFKIVKMQNDDQQYIERDGTVLPVKVIDNPIYNEHKQVIGKVFTFRDVFKEKIYEERLKKAKEVAEEASMLKSDFLANMSHELRTPLNSILGLTELALEGDNDDERNEYLTIVRQAGESLLFLINTILDFSKIESGKVNIENTRFDLVELLEDCVQKLYIQARNKGIDLYLIVPHDLPRQMIGDQNKLYQIMVNLVGNGIKFTNGGQIMVSAKPDSETDEYCRFSFCVKDTGIGIPENKKQIIFDAFTQADSSTTRIHGGTGLGLAIVKRLLDLMGGSIEIESEVGKGSNFIFHLQFMKDHEPPNTYGSPEDEPFSEDFSIAYYSPKPVIRDIMKESLLALKIPRILGLSDDYLNPNTFAIPNTEILIIDSHTPDAGRYIDFLHEAEPDRPEIIVVCDVNEQSDWYDRKIMYFVFKPIRRNQLLKLVRKAAGSLEGIGPEQKGSKKPIIKKTGFPLTILLIEDDESNQLIVKRLLELRGHTCSVCGDAVDALKILRECRFDVILMDIQMPEMSGFDITKIIRKNETGDFFSDVPIIALTAHAGFAMKNRCFQAGMNAYISKPYDIHNFLSIIEKSVALSETGNNTVKLTAFLGNVRFWLENSNYKQIESRGKELYEMLDEKIYSSIRDDLFRLILASRRRDKVRIDDVISLFENHLRMDGNMGEISL